MRRRTGWWRLVRGACGGSRRIGSICTCLHWRGRYSLAETVAGFRALQAQGKIRHWGVSNLDVGELEEVVDVPGGEGCATDQVLFNLTRRGPAFDLLPWCRARGMPVMAYSPIEQGRLKANDGLEAVARRHGVDRFAVALAWVVHQAGVIAIPKAARIAHVEANRAAAEMPLSTDDLQVLDRAFPAPDRKTPLAML